MHTSRSHWCLIRTSRQTFISSMPVRSWNWRTFSVCSLVSPSASIFPAVEGLRSQLLSLLFAFTQCVRVCACVGANGPWLSPWCCFCCKLAFVQWLSRCGGGRGMSSVVTKCFYWSPGVISTHAKLPHYNVFNISRQFISFSQVIACSSSCLSANDPMNLVVND